MEQTNLMAEILDILNREAHISPVSVSPIHRGLLNEKWVVVTEKERWFVKSYSIERYARYVPDVWDEMERALELQHRLSRLTSACPHILPVDGKLLQTTPSGRRFVVMEEHLQGSGICAGSANERQMYFLGRETARMHQAWQNDNDLARSIFPNEPIWHVSKDAMLTRWEQRWGALENKPSGNVLQTMQMQKEIIESFHEEDVQWAKPGWTHLDLWVDNLLFHEDELSAIVDFDRVRYSFPAIDIGRAILSCTLNEGRINQDAASAFADGYRSVMHLPKGRIVDAVRYCWWVESFWWLRPTFEDFSPNPARFAEEIIWVSQHWSKLDRMVGSI